MNNKKIAIVGPTASGKTSLSLQISQRYNGEIINADSRNVYIGMDIGTAKPTEKEQNLVKHHLLDIKKPHEKYNAAQFQADAERVIGGILGGGKLPVMVGGTGLYIDAVLYGYEFPHDNSAQRPELDRLSDEELLKRLEVVDPDASDWVDTANRRRVIRAIETAGEGRKKQAEVDPSWLVIGLNPGVDNLYKNIVQRAQEQLSTGVIKETQNLINEYGESIESLNTVPYREVIEYLHGGLSRDELEQKIAIKNRQLARRQMTWFKRNPQIQWFETGSDAMITVEKFLKA